MIEVECTARKWGNSIGFTLPKEVAEQEGITHNDKVYVIIEKKLRVKEVFGLAKDWKRPTQEIKDEMKKGWG
jgi:antitoxin component of MazEF toxin-antitoxin module